MQHGTNKHGLKMMLWVTVDGTGSTKILACSLMLDESAESCAWSCQCFLDAFRVAPYVIFSDSAPQLETAIASVFPESKHLYCIWHLSNNMVTNLKAACGADNALWQRVCSRWWRIAKQTDTSSRLTWEAEWAELGALLDESTVTGKSMNTARAWLAKMAKKRESWAYRYTWGLRTLGLHSTQRIEAVHSAISHFLRASTLLTNLLPQMERYALNVEERASVRHYKFVQRQLLAADQMVAHPFIAALTLKLTGYALVLFKGQLHQSAHYLAAALEGQEGLFSITRRSLEWGAQGGAQEQGGDAELGISSPLFSVPRTTSLTTCSCQYLDCYGVPCRHMLLLYSIQQMACVPLDLFDARWRVLTPEMELAMVRALMQRRPARAPPGPAAPLSREERYAQILVSGRAVAAIGAESHATFTASIDGLTALLSQLRVPGGELGAIGPARRRGAAVGASRGAAAAAAVTAPRECHSCWGFLPIPHNQRNRRCPNFGKPPLPRPGAVAAACIVGCADSSDSSEGEEDEGDGHDNVCHECSETGELLMCDRCPHSWHMDCLPVAMLPGVDANPWLCPVCACVPRTVGFVAPPQRAPPGRGGGQHMARKRPATEPAPARRRELKKSNRSGETRFR